MLTTQLTRETALERIKKVISDKLGEEEVNESSNLYNDLGADSLDALELCMEFETAFDMEIPERIFEKIQTIGQVIDFVVDQKEPD